MYSMSTNRLILRPFCNEDVDRLVKLADQRRIVDSIIAIPQPYDDRIAISWIHETQRQFKSGSGFHFAITLPEQESDAVGYVALSQIDQENEEAQLSFWIGEEFQNQGITTEAVRALITFGVSVLGLNRICAYHMVHNTAACRVLSKVGMTKEGALRQRIRRHSQFNDVLVWSILASDWSANSSYGPTDLEISALESTNTLSLPVLDPDHRSFLAHFN